MVLASRLELLVMMWMFLFRLSRSQIISIPMIMSQNQQTGALSDDVDVLVQVIQESNNKYPSDYVPESAQQVVDKATVEVNTDFENCADYTESLGYE